MGLRSTTGTGGGEIVQVQGGHIIRATGRKDRHSKVFTSKGPRDRRVRLSAHTAIQFYDVQDRLGYDRPSKAVDWLINKAKASIDKLAQLPPWDPSDVVANSNINAAGGDDDQHQPDNVGCTDHIPVAHHTGTSSYHWDSQPLSSSTDSMMMKSLFPTTAGENASINFQNYPHELISRGTSTQNQDLCLSLHTTLEDPRGNSNSATHHNQTLFQGSGSGYDVGWSGSAGLTRLMGYPSSLMPPPQPQSGYSNFQRGTLQSSFSPFLVQAQHEHSNHTSSMLGIGHGSDQGFMGNFNMPAQIHGDHHHHQLQLHGGVSMSNNSGSSSSAISPDSSQQ